jgi:hypothetical protein
MVSGFIHKHPTATVIICWAFFYCAWIFLVPDEWADAVKSFFTHVIVGVEHQRTPTDLTIKF